MAARAGDLGAGWQRALSRRARECPRRRKSRNGILQTLALASQGWELEEIHGTSSVVLPPGSECCGSHLRELLRAASRDWVAPRMVCAFAGRCCLQRRRRFRSPPVEMILSLVAIQLDCRKWIIIVVVVGCGRLNVFWLNAFCLSALFRQKQDLPLGPLRLSSRGEG